MQKYFIHSESSIEEVFAHIKNFIETDNGRANINGTSVGVSSLRLQTFYHTGTVCHACGLKATHFELNRDKGAEARNAPYHLNLWGINEAGDKVLFTHDHKLARSLGGKDDLTNTETMCGPCNWAKGTPERAEADRRRKAKKLEKENGTA
jgi:hypothetical protein